MPYTVTRYQLIPDPDGKFPVVIADNTINNTTTTLNIIGKGVSNYGQYIADDFVWLVENFAGPNAPANPIRGQEWYDTTDQFMKLFNGTTWVNVGPFTTDQDIVISTSINGNPVLEVILNGTIIAIWSGTTFVPSPAISGFPVIDAGLNLNGSLNPLPVFNGELASTTSNSVVVLSGTSYSYVPTDRNKIYARSNSGIAMLDTLPNPSLAGVGNGWQVSIINEDSSANLVVGAASGTIDGGSTLSIGPSASVVFATNGTNWYSQRGLVPLSIPNSALAPMAANTIKGNNIGVLTTPLDLTVSQVQTMLGLGTAAYKATSGAEPTVSSVSGSTTAGHVAVFADSTGTIEDGGAPLNNLTVTDGTHSVGNTGVISFSGATVSGTSPNATVTITTPFSIKFTSSLIPIPGPSALLTTAHDMGVMPFNVLVFLVCTSSAFGYTTGQKISALGLTSTSYPGVGYSGSSFSLFIDATNIYFQMGTFGQIWIYDAGGGGHGVDSASPFALLFEAYV